MTVNINANGRSSTSIGPYNLKSISLFMNYAINIGLSEVFNFKAIMCQPSSFGFQDLLRCAGGLGSRSGRNGTKDQGEAKQHRASAGDPDLATMLD